MNIEPIPRLVWSTEVKNAKIFSEGPNPQKVRISFDVLIQLVKKDSLSLDGVAFRKQEGQIKFPTEIDKAIQKKLVEICQNKLIQVRKIKQEKLKQQRRQLQILEQQQESERQRTQFRNTQPSIQQQQSNQDDAAREREERSKREREEQQKIREQQQKRRKEQQNRRNSNQSSSNNPEVRSNQNHSPSGNYYQSANIFGGNSHPNIQRSQSPFNSLKTGQNNSTSSTANQPVNQQQGSISNIFQSNNQQGSAFSLSNRQGPMRYFAAPKPQQSLLFGPTVSNNTNHNNNNRVGSTNYNRRYRKNCHERI